VWNSFGFSRPFEEAVQDSPGIPRTFVGFGFGAIQGGLFVYEAFRSGNFDRLVVADVVPEVVGALRRTKGSYRVRVATRSGLEAHQIEGVEAYNPNDPADRAALVAAVAEAREMATALPSVESYDQGPAPVAGILSDGLKLRTMPGVLYAAENHNHAAEILEGKVATPCAGFQFLNTVIGKMSGVAADASSREFLVEEFNRILITKIALPGFRRGIEVFEEKPDLLPFEEAKLYGHNAVHALLGYLLRREGASYMAQAREFPELLRFAREAFLEESGAALCRRHRGVDPLFTEDGYRAYAEDLLERMLNVHLRDAVGRVTRDTRRKLGWSDRLVGTMRLALDAGIAPRRFARGAAAALEALASESPSPGRSREKLLDSLWPEPDHPQGRKRELKELILHAG
jgi:mannitol-1-phosphate 5-dehydrogenase